MSSRVTEAQVLIFICTLSTIFTFSFGALTTPVKLSVFWYKIETVKKRKEREKKSSFC